MKSFKNLFYFSGILIFLTASEFGQIHAAYRGPTTSAGVNLIKGFEGFRANFYNDAVGIRTIGYGYNCRAHPCDQIHPPITVAQATTLLQTQLRSFEACINSSVTYANLNASQFSALVSFAFNLGCGSLKSSTLLRKLNAGNVAGASLEFPKWNKAGGKVLSGLTRRRAAEKQLFCSGGTC